MFYFDCIYHSGLETTFTAIEKTVSVLELDRTQSNMTVRKYIPQKARITIYSLVLEMAQKI